MLNREIWGLFFGGSGLNMIGVLVIYGVVGWWWITIVMNIKEEAEYRFSFLIEEGTRPFERDGVAAVC